MRTAIALIVLTALVTPVSLAPAQISPGPLAAVHRELEGASNCTQCHALRRGSLSQACASCHRDIAWLVERGRGLHARAAREKRECASCHPDHAGRDFALISWPGGSPPRFDHAQAGWTLELSHRETKCEQCHTSALRGGPAAALSKRRGTAGWVGLETACISCHRADDAHKGALESQCESCHDAGKWSRAPRFAHDSTAYPLTGGHRDVSCNGCHLSARLPSRRTTAGDRIPVYKPVPHGECVACHDDPHRGRLSARCSECHSTRTFDVGDRGDFNHTLTRYPLQGKHARVACGGCHGSNLTRRAPAFATCASCHSDPHAGQATLRGAPADCAACHGVQGFSPSTYTVRQHATAPYALEGKHAAVACGSCHRDRSPTTSVARGVARLRMPYAQCHDCHTDAHGAQLLRAGRRATGAERERVVSGARESSGASVDGCHVCHTVQGWSPSTFTVAQHAGLALTLDGRHAEITCGSCHARTRQGLPPHPATLSLGSAGIALRPPPKCASCHVDAHERRSASSPKASDTCQTCHNARQWRPSTIDAQAHAAYSFPLEGAHRAVACAGCHGELGATHRPASTLVQSARGVTRLPFTPRQSTSCASCHESPHGAQFAHRKDRGACESCHGLDAFSSAPRFDHERDAAFPLRGGHARVACGRCHVAAAGASPASVVYRPLSTRCESCHSGERPGRSP